MTRRPREALLDLPVGSPIFVLGAMRSGSTLLRLMLDSHPRIAIGPESGFMGAASAMLSIPGWKPGPGWYQRFGVSNEQMIEQVRRFFSDFFSDYAARQGKQRWGDKTPFHNWYVEQMAQLFPDAVFVAIVRHPAAMALSARRWHYSVEESVDRWVRVNTELVRIGALLGPRRFALCRYEDVVLQPEPTMRQLLDFLGEPWSDEVLRHGEVQREQGARRVTDGGTRVGDSLDPGRVERWTRQIAADEQATVAALAEALAGLLGYALRCAGPLPLTRDGSNPTFLLDGDDLRHLVERARGVVAFVPQGRYPLEDTQDLAQRLLRAERALARMRARRSVRLGEAMRRAQRAHPLGGLRDVLLSLRARR